MRDTVAVINLAALSHNIDVIQKQSLKTVFPVVKANAYGHGMLDVASYLDEKSYPYICVSSIDEALKLYEERIKTPILIFSYVSKDAIKDYHRDNFVYTVTSMSHLTEIEELDFQVKLHLEINSGMNRYGIKPINYQEINTKHEIEGVYTHFSSNEINKYTISQAKIFKDFIFSLVVKPKVVHVGNAPIDLIKDETYIHGLRLGLGMYGYRENVHNLKPVLSLSSKVNHIDTLLAGESLGYDQTYIAKNEERYATIPIGYGDGFDMRNDMSVVYINDNQYKIIGKICMDQLMVLVDNSVQINDQVELIGPSRNVLKISKDTGISPYVILTSLSERVRRQYIK